MMITDPETKKNGGAKALRHIKAELKKDPGNKDLKKVERILNKNRRRTIRQLRKIMDKSLQESVANNLNKKPKVAKEKPVSVASSR
ncbi:MAG: hypothetical protein GY847_00415 [Proteobacteria bacterium]|nr:hypothetical protein [Pseudomonadota bacterium]